MTAFYGLLCDTVKHTKNTTSESRLSKPKPMCNLHAGTVESKTEQVSQVSTLK